ncbi:hypothetical protein EDD22DRAFT_952610 [Suillus occidentalis]|nr:hypothetical protein EDD22DRAFT_952610 [Suillus occidentalis]
MGIVSPEYINHRRFKSLNGFYFAVATFLVVATFLSNVPNISLGSSFASFSTQCQSTVIASFHVWKWYIQGPISTLPMLCTLRPDSQLKDAKDIKWYNDPDNDSPMPPLPPPATSNGKITAFVSHHSGRPIKLTEKIRDAVNSAPAKRPAPAAPEGQPAPKRIREEPPATEGLSDKEEEEDREEAYEKTKALGDEDREHHKLTKKDERSVDLKTIFTQEKGHMNPHTQECEDG